VNADSAKILSSYNILKFLNTQKQVNLYRKKWHNKSKENKN